MNCPICSEQELTQETYEAVDLDICPKCNGTWLDPAGLSLIVDKKEEKFEPDLIVETLSAAKSGIDTDEQIKKLKCPVCSVTMSKVNYDYSSGVIIDVCSQHGIWLDEGELDKIQIHREHWQEGDISSSNEKEGKIRSLLEKVKSLLG